MLTCAHTVVTCLNPYDFIRKYRCESCHGVMMCACEEKFGRRFLPHQLDQGTVLETQERVPVTLGFQPKICRPCRGLPEEAHPNAERYRRKSKILRYYWREIWFEQTRRFEEWKEQQRASGVNDPVKEREMGQTIERQVIDEFKELHSRSPKYQFKDESQNHVLRECNVEVVNLDGTFVKTGERKVVLLDDTATCSAEEFTSRHFERLGYSVLVTESRPLHVLFGTFLWLLIQDPNDPQVRIVGFGERAAFDRGERGEQIWTHLPEDFGAPGYAARRAEAIENHFESMLAGDTESLLWAFDYWIPHSDRFRNYLWAHKLEDVATARRLVEIIPADIIRRILRYLLGAYFKRYCGWPDLLVSNDSEYFFAEVKASKDELSQDQKNWIHGNHAELHLPFKLVKIHRRRVVSDAKRDSGQ